MHPVIMTCNWCFITQHTLILRAEKFLFVVVVFNTQALGWLAFTFCSLSTILQLVESECKTAVWKKVVIQYGVTFYAQDTWDRWIDSVNKLLDMADDSRKLATASSLGKAGIIFLLMTFFPSFLLAVSGIVSWKISLVFLILNLAEWDESLHIDTVPLFAVSLLPRTMQWDGIHWTSVCFWRHCNCLIDEGISVTILLIHLWSLLSFLPFLIFSCAI